MTDKVKVLLNGKEYFKINNIVIQEGIDGFLSLRTTNINVLFNNIKTREFNALLKDKGSLPIQVVINEKVWQDSFITQSNIDEQKNENGGTILSINIPDIFQTLLNSDVIDVYYQKHKTLQLALSRTLKELGFTDFQIKNGNGIQNIDLKNGGDKNFTKGGSCQDFLGEICSLYKVILKSNGVNTLTIERYNSNKNITDNIYVITDLDGKVVRSNTQFIQKVGNGNNSPSRIIILNTKKMRDTSATSVIVPFKNGMPFTQRIRTLSMKASPQQTSEGITYEMMGMTAIANSNVYALPHKIFDRNGDFYSINTLIKVRDEERGIDEDMNIVSFSTIIDSNGGSNTTLNLVNQQAFDSLENLITKKSLLKK